jgi:MYXO-CTERM domain-containing protein
MSPTPKPWAIRSILASLFALLLLFAAAVLGAPPTASQVDATQELQRYLSGPTSELDVELARMGFEPPVPRSEWAQWSAERKIYAAYIAAEEAAEGSGARVLERLTGQLHATYGDSVYANEHLAALGSGRADDSPINFKKPALPDIDAAKPSKQLGGQIAELSRYLSGGVFGSATDVLHNHFSYSVYDSVEMAIRHGGDMESMLRAVQRDKPQVFEKGVALLTNRIAEIYGRGPFDGPNGPQPGGGGPRKGPPSPRPPSPPPASKHADFVEHSAAPPTPTPPTSGGGHSRNTGRYTSFLRREVQSGGSVVGPSGPSSMKFSRMSRGARGFGGVVFGNETRLDRDLGAMTEMEFRADPRGSVGVFVLTFTSGDTLTFGPVPIDHAHAARRMVAGEIPGLQPLAIDDGVGLVGIADNTPFVERCDAKAREVELGQSAFHVVTHPALEDTALGWAALYVDVWPISIEGSLRTLDAAATDDDEAFVRRLFSGTKHALSAGTWKVVDAPIEFVAEGRSLVPRRMADDMPEPILTTSFLDMHVITRLADVGVDGGLARVAEETEGIDHGFERRFAEALPVLTRVSWAYHELNRFAPVLALTRIARHDGVELPEIAAPARGEATPLAITIGSEGLQVLPPFDREKLAAPSVERLEQCLQDAVKRKKAVGKFLDDKARILQVLRGEPLEDRDPDILFAARVLQLALRISQPGIIDDAAVLDDAPADPGEEPEAEEPEKADAQDAELELTRAVRPSGCNCTTSSDPPSGWLSLLLVLGVVGCRSRRARRV